MYINRVDLQKNSEPRQGNNPYYIILHHSEASSCSIYDINQWHLQNGWCCVGYHYFVRKDGSIWQGRKEYEIGSHCPNYNSNSIGICAEGNFMYETMGQAQKNSIIELIADIKGRYNIEKIYRHGDVYSTDCCGTNFPFDEVVGGKVSIAVGDIRYSEQCKYLQILCNQVNGAGIAEDGYWGVNTENAVRQLPLLRVGDSGTAVRHIQNVVGVKADAVFGQATKRAVMAWQNAHGLSADGIVGFNTYKSFV